MKHGENGDPWLAPSQDPWANYGGPSAPSSSAAQGVLPDRVQQLEQRLQSNLEAAITKKLEQAPAQMETDDDGFRAKAEERFSRLETGLVELQAQNCKFETWFGQMHQADQFLSAQLSETNQRLDQVAATTQEQRKVLANNMESMQNQMSTGFALWKLCCLSIKDVNID